MMAQVIAPAILRSRVDVWFDRCTLEADSDGDRLGLHPGVG